MNLSQLERLGKVAGIGGIALGAMVLILYQLISTIRGLSPEQQAGAVRLIAIGCFIIGGLGILGWVTANWSGVRKVPTKKDPSPAGGTVITKATNLRR